MTIRLLPAPSGQPKGSFAQIAALMVPTTNSDSIRMLNSPAPIWAGDQHINAFDGKKNRTQSRNIQWIWSS